MSQPPIIGSGKPHTVSLKPGSNVAVSTPRRDPEDSATAGGVRRNARLRAGADSDPVNRAVTADALRKPAPDVSPVGRAVDTPAAQGLSEAILQRIQQLKQRNNVVGQALGGLPASDPSAP